MSLSVPFTGGCACGAIRYECSGAPLLSLNCHCRECQHATGSAYAAEFAVLKDALRLVKGMPTYYVPPANQGNARRKVFCGDCGSPVLIFNDTRGICIIAATSLDDPREFRPEMDFYTESAQPWDVMNPALPKYETMPPDEEIQAIIASRS